MAQVAYVENGEVRFVHEVQSPTNFTSGTERFSRERGGPWAISHATRMREAGIHSARALTDKGQRMETEELVQADLAKLAPPAADSRPATYRGVVPELVRGRYFIKWTDPVTNQGLCIEGATPQEALEKLFSNDHPAVLRFIETLPPEEGAPPIAPASAPETAASPARHLRPGDARDVPHELPQRRESVSESQSVQARRQEFVTWEAGASVADLKIRLKNDPEFQSWYSNQNVAGVERDTKNFFNRTGA